jgi:GGDEF domain-containing protein
MAERAELMEAALDSFREGLALINEEASVVFWNRAAESVTGFSRGEMVAQKAGPALEPLLACGVPNEEDEETPPRRGVLVHAHAKGGCDLALRARMLVLRNDLGERIGTAVIFRPAQRIDELPGGAIDSDSDQGQVLADIKDRAESVTEGLRQNGEPFGLFWIAVDQAHCLRKTHGAKACEEMRRKLERALACGLRQGEEIGSWSEEGFLVVVRAAGPQELARRANGLVQLVRAVEFRWWGDRVALTVSIGAAQAEPEEGLAEILERAQAAVTASAEAGGNQWTLAAGRRA